MNYLNSKLLNQVKYLQDTTDYSFTEISFKKFSSRKKNLTPTLSKREGADFCNANIPITKKSSY